MTQAGREHTGRPTEAMSLGQCLIGDLDNVAEALAVAEGEAFR
jgi:hypothetical protein